MQSTKRNLRRIGVGEEDVAAREQSFRDRHTEILGSDRSSEPDLGKPSLPPQAAPEELTTVDVVDHLGSLREALAKAKEMAWQLPTVMRSEAEERREEINKAVARPVYSSPKEGSEPSFLDERKQRSLEEALASFHFFMRQTPAVEEKQSEMIASIEAIEEIVSEHEARFSAENER